MEHPSTPTLFVVSAPRTRTKDSATFIRELRQEASWRDEAHKISEQHNKLVKNCVACAHRNIFICFCFAEISHIEPNTKIISMVRVIWI